jgi:hypothetical protein
MKFKYLDEVSGSSKFYGPYEGQVQEYFEPGESGIAKYKIVARLAIYGHNLTIYVEEDELVPNTNKESQCLA